MAQQFPFELKAGQLMAQNLHLRFAKCFRRLLFIQRRAIDYHVIFLIIFITECLKAHV